MQSFPTQDEIDNLPFKIFNKSSASPTLLIHNKKTDPQVVLKLWEKSELPIYKGLEYEKSVYSEKINPLIENNENSPFLRYIGEGNCASFKDLVSYLGITDNENAKNFLKLALYIYGLKEEKNKTFKYSSLDEYNDKYLDFVYPSPRERNKLNSVERKDYQCIILPYIYMITFKDALESYNSDNIIKIIRHILRGIYLMYTNNVSHNDLHPGNIMIEEKTNNVFIFDWDRAYCPELLDNPILSSDVCKLPCNISQCNIFHKDGYCIDFYKILFYILKKREDKDWQFILTSLGINNIVDLENREEDILGLVIKTILGEDIYSRGDYNKGNFNMQIEDKKCSWLQDRTLITEENTSMDNLHKKLGPYQIIYMKSVQIAGGDITELESKPIPKELVKYFNHLLSGIQQTNFSFVKNSQKGHVKYPFQKELPFKQNLDKYPKISRTFGNLLRLKNLTNSKKIIFPIDSHKITENKPVKPKSIVKIIIDNDRRKFKN